VSKTVAGKRNISKNMKNVMAKLFALRLASVWRRAHKHCRAAAAWCAAAKKTGDGGGLVGELAV